MMEYAPSAFDAVMQQALDVLRDYVKHNKEYRQNGSVSVSVPQILKDCGYSADDAQRVYSGLKRLGLVTVLKNGHAYVPPTITVDKDTSVALRRMEKLVSRKGRRKLTGNAAELAYIETQIADAELALVRLQRDRATVLAKIARTKSKTTPTK
jgi:hypothetical protein